MNTWEVIAHMIKAQGIEYIFGIGDTDLQLFAKNVEGLTPINVRYEGSAPFMAMAYSRLTGRPGVCSGSSGPGIASLVPGALEAFSGCIPLLIIGPSINQNTEGMGEFQECDQIGMMKSVTKWSARISSVERIPWFIRRAFSIALNGQPGPVFLEMPINIGGKVTSGIIVEMGEMPAYKPVEKIKTAGDEKLINEAVDLILEAKRPLLIAGNGAKLSGAKKEFKEMVELLGVPFVTTPGGRGILSEEHPLALGLPGLYRTRVEKEEYSRADLIISVGSRNEGFQTHSWADFPEGAKFIQIDISPFEIGRNWIPDVGIVGDVSLTLQQIIRKTKDKKQEMKIFTELIRVKELVAAKEAFEEEVKKECLIDEKPISVKRIVYEASRVFGRNTIVVNENGSQDTWSYCFPYYKVMNDSDCIPVAEQTCMGMGIVGAIAAKMTKPEKNVICFAGDGAFQMYMKEIPTAVQNGVACTWIVLNNSCLGWIKHYQQQNVGFDVATFDFQPDFMKWAEACNCAAERIEDPQQVRPALQRALELNKEGKPVILEFITGLDLSHFERSK